MPFFPLYKVQSINILREFIAQFTAERSWSGLTPPLSWGHHLFVVFLYFQLVFCIPGCLFLRFSDFGPFYLHHLILQPLESIKRSRDDRITVLASTLHMFSYRENSRRASEEDRNRKRCFFCPISRIRQLLQCKGDRFVYWLIQRDDEHDNRTYCTVPCIFELLCVMLKLLKDKPVVLTTSASSSLFSCIFETLGLGNGGCEKMLQQQQ